jgi:hypothetical protein
MGKNHWLTEADFYGDGAESLPMEIPRDSTWGLKKSLTFSNRGADTWDV